MPDEVTTAPASGDPKVSDEMIRSGSGRPWAEWVEVLDAWGARERTHTEVARHVVELGVDPWWAQAVTVGYERITGQRAVGQRMDGSYSGSASRTFAADLARVEPLWTEAAGRDQWLPPGLLALRTASPGKSARFDQADGGGILAVWFTGKGMGKCSVQVQQEKLPSKDAADTFGATWRARFDALDVLLAHDNACSQSSSVP